MTMKRIQRMTSLTTEKPTDVLVVSVTAPAAPTTSDAPISKQKLIKAGRTAWLIWAVSWSFLLFQFFLQLLSGEMIDGMMKSFSLTAFGGGVLTGVYYYIYVVLQIPAGVMIDYFGPRRLLAASAVIYAVGCFFFRELTQFNICCYWTFDDGWRCCFFFCGFFKLNSKMVS